MGTTIQSLLREAENISYLFLGLLKAVTWIHMACTRRWCVFWNLLCQDAVEVPHFWDIHFPVVCVVSGVGTGMGNMNTRHRDLFHLDWKCDHLKSVYIQLHVNCGIQRNFNQEQFNIKPAILTRLLYLELHFYKFYVQGDTKKTGTFEKPNKNWRNPTKKFWQKLNHYNLPFKRQ